MICWVTGWVLIYHPKPDNDHKPKTPRAIPGGSVFWSGQLIPTGVSIDPSLPGVNCAILGRTTQYVSFTGGPMPDPKTPKTKTKTKSQRQWQNRIVGEGVEAPDQLMPNPRNWRIHPLTQQHALEGLLDQVGWIQRVIVNKRTGNLIDGHLRVQVAISKGEPEVPVLYVDLSEAEEDLALASIDPLSAMAVTDRQMLTEILDELTINSDALREALFDVVADLDALSGDGVEDAEQDDEDVDTAQDPNVLDLVGVTIDDPTSLDQVHHGQTWRIGDTGHLYIGDVLREWSQYVGLLTGDVLFLPYPSRYTVASEAIRSRGFVMVQPDLYSAAWIIDTARAVGVAAELV